MKNSRHSNGLLHTLTVRRAPRLPGEAHSRGFFQAGMDRLPCALGRTGVTRGKREGDGATPAGEMRLLDGFYRPDVMSRPRCSIPLRPLKPGLAWCDDPASPLYNRLHDLPSRAGHEVMWRKDALYNVVFVLDYNMQPRRYGRGSAIFLHCAKPDFSPTLGCVALRPADMRRLLPRLAPKVRLIVR